jgi:predicted molibdopterin-dependent oxidoreductase YjgC
MQKLARAIIGTERADILLRPRPGTDLAWLGAVSRYILDNGLAKMDFVNQWVNGFAEYKKRVLNRSRWNLPRKSVAY